MSDWIAKPDSFIPAAILNEPLTRAKRLAERMVTDGTCWIHRISDCTAPSPRRIN